MNVLQEDVNLLLRYGLMDYSLLMCIQKNPNKDSKMLFNEDKELDDLSRHRFMSSCGRFIYRIGIIDYLQSYNMAKRAENFIKTRLLFKGDGDGGISAVPPEAYAKRFMHSMRGKVIIAAPDSIDSDEEQFHPKKDWNIIDPLFKKFIFKNLQKNQHHKI